MIRDSCGNVLLRTVVASTSAGAMIKKIWSRKREGGRERERDLYACVCVVGGGVGFVNEWMRKK